MHAELETLRGRLSGRPVRGYSTFDFGRQRDGACRSVVVPHDEAEDLVRALRRELSPEWLAFIGTTNWLGDEQPEDAVEVVVGPGQSQFDMLRLARTDAVNHGMGTEELITRLRRYDADVGISLLQAESDTLVFDIVREPADWSAFARELDAFCPDVVQQGVETVEELERQIRKMRQVLLWWD